MYFIQKQSQRGTGFARNRYRRRTQRKHAQHYFIRHGMGKKQDANNGDAPCDDQIAQRQQAFDNSEQRNGTQEQEIQHQIGEFEDALLQYIGGIYYAREWGRED